MKWYDIFSNFYDSSLEKLYAESRKKAVDYLNLKNNETVLDVACGTGTNFKHLKSKNKNVPIFGTDFSSGMLSKAQIQIDKNSWENITLFEADARTLSNDFIAKKLKKNIHFDNIICVLGLSVIPDWESVLDSLIALLAENGKIVIVDVFAEKRDLKTWLVEKIARADLDRKIWQTLENKTTHFTMEYLPVAKSKVGGKLFVAVGSKK